MLKAAYHILVSGAETMGAFNTGFETVNLHRPTGGSDDAESLARIHIKVLMVFKQFEESLSRDGCAAICIRGALHVAAQVEIEIKVEVEL